MHPPCLKKEVHKCEHKRYTGSHKGYDFKDLFMDTSSMYTFIEENEIAKRGHNKMDSYELNQMSYYIAANHDYVFLYSESYVGIMHDSRTFESKTMNMPDNSALLFDR